MNLFNFAIVKQDIHTNHIVEHLEYLLTRYDCVIVPQWGAFLVEYEPARIQEETKIFLPPTRRLTFNQDVTHSDGLLANSIMRRENITYEQANSLILDEVQMMRRQLMVDGEIAFGRLGWFSHYDGIFCFEPNQNASLTPSLAYLPQIQLVDIAEKAASDARREQLQEAYYKTTARPRKRLWRFAASFAILLGVGFVAATSDITTSETAQASLGITPKRSTVIKTASVSVDRLPQLVIYAKEDGKETVDMEKKMAQKNSVNQPQRQGAMDFAKDVYGIIVASLNSYQGAVDYTKGFPDLDLKIIQVDQNRYRVCAATSQSPEAAYRICTDDDFAKRFPSAWVAKIK